jgi:hypothetical protein
VSAGRQCSLTRSSNFNELAFRNWITSDFEVKNLRLSTDRIIQAATVPNSNTTHMTVKDKNNQKEFSLEH